MFLVFEVQKCICDLSSSCYSPLFGVVRRVCQFYVFINLYLYH